MKASKSKMRYKISTVHSYCCSSSSSPLCGVFATRSLSAKNEAAVDAVPLPSPSPTPRTREELPQDSDEVVKVETNLTNIFFTAADKNKRFVSNLKPKTFACSKTDSNRTFLRSKQTSICRCHSRF